jgi:hypothetical protein
MQGTVHLIVGECPWCLKESALDISEGEAKKIWEWNEKGRPGYIQEELSFLSKGQREQLLSGAHSKCWDEMFPEEEEERDRNGRIVKEEEL